jgi:hypothetical protein
MLETDNNGQRKYYICRCLGDEPFFVVPSNRVLPFYLKEKGAQLER